MQPFFVSPTESLLIGLCLGGYLQRKEYGVDVHFLDVVESWLKPFVPAFNKTRRFAITAEEIPEDVELSGESDDSHGRSPTHPNMIFGIGPAGAFCVVFDCDRKSLLDLLNAFLGKHIVRAPIDGLLYPAVEKRGLPQVWMEVQATIREACEKGDITVVTGRCGEENGEAIAHRLEELIQFNECGDTFSVGRGFGRAVTMFEDFAERLTRLEQSHVLGLDRCDGLEAGIGPEDLGFDIEDSECQSELDVILHRAELAVYPTILQDLVVSSLVKRSMYAERCLADCSLPPLAWSWQNDVFETNHDAAIQHVNRSRMKLWLAFGELLGFLRDADSLARSAEWTSAAPRSFRELFDASGDKVRNAIRDAELVLSTDTSENVAAKTVGMLANGIEALAKRIWSIQSSSSQQTQTLMQELMSKRQSGSEDEQRFASIAITLYKSYRNPVVHEFDKFQCSVNEARFFVLGMRTLLELSDRILAIGRK